MTNLWGTKASNLEAQPRTSLNLGIHGRIYVVELLDVFSASGVDEGQNWHQKRDYFETPRNRGSDLATSRGMSLCMCQRSEYSALGRHSELVGLKLSEGHR
jgi:hypothetical protein